MFYRGFAVQFSTVRSLKREGDRRDLAIDTLYMSAPCSTWG